MGQSRRTARPSSDVHMAWHLHEQPIHILLYFPRNCRIDIDANRVVLALLCRRIESQIATKTLNTHT